MATKASETATATGTHSGNATPANQQPKVRKERRQLTPEQRAARKALLAQESKADKFRRLANRRVQRALILLGHVRNLTNKNQYEYTAEQANKIVQALSTHVGLIKAGFEGSAKERQSFTV